MSARWLGGVCVLAAAAGLVAYKEARRRVEPHPSSASATATAPGRVVLLVADPSEAGTADACGEIFRLVRAAGEQGVAVREVPPDGDPEVLRRHRVTVAPTVIILGDEERELARHEGESRETIDAIRADLEKLSRQRP